MLSTTSMVLIGIVGVALVLLVMSIQIVPQMQVRVIETLGKFKVGLESGFYMLIPFVERAAYKQTLKEQAMDVAPQICITKDNIPIEVDGIIYLQVKDAVKASYGIVDYGFALTQLSQTTMRSIIGKMELDKTFEEREHINHHIVAAVEKACEPWGVHVTRYEIKNIVPPKSIREAMEKQMKAERDKRAMIAESEGEKLAIINVADGKKQKIILEAQGKAAEIETVANATANGVRAVALAINEKSGSEAVNLRVAESYIHEFGKLAGTNNTMIIPSDLSNIAGLVATATSVVKKTIGVNGSASDAGLE